MFCRTSDPPPFSSMRAASRTVEEYFRRTESLWHFPDITRSEATQRVLDRPIGTFIVRKSQKAPYALSRRVPTKLQPVAHLTITLNDKGYLQLGSSHLFFNSIYDLLAYFSSVKSALPCKLRKPTDDQWVEGLVCAYKNVKLGRHTQGRTTQNGSDGNQKASVALHKSKQRDAGSNGHDVVHYEEVGGHVYSVPNEHPEVAKRSATPKSMTVTQQVGHEVLKNASEDSLYAVPKKPLWKKATSTTEQAPLKTDQHNATDEAPPVPPRLYTWSDVEDDDDELFLNDNDNDSLAMTPPQKTSLTIPSKELLQLLEPVQKDNCGYAAVQDVLGSHMAQKEPKTSGPLRDFSHSDSGTKLIKPSEEQVQPLKRHSAATLDEGHGYSSIQEAMEGFSKYKTPEQDQTSLQTKPPDVDQAQIMQEQKLLTILRNKSRKENIRQSRRETKRKQRNNGQQENEVQSTLGNGLEVKPQQKYFGTPLVEVVKEDGVPLLFKHCVQIVEEKGLHISGIYRLPGDKETCLHLQEKIDKDSTLHLATLNLPVKVITSTLKVFFKLLPEPLIDDTAVNKMLDFYDQEDQCQAMHSILGHMRQCNLRTLYHLMQHLHKVQQHQNINGMSAGSLAIVFGFILMRPPLADLADPEKQICWQLTTTRLIEYPEYIPDGQID